MDKRKNARISEKTISRRSFLKSTAIIAAASFTPRIRNITYYETIKTGNSEQPKNVLFSSEFVPEGACFKLAFVADHHYWPDHLKNWGRGTQQTRHSKERMLDLIETLNTEAPDVSVHGGDVINGGRAFEPPFDEYIKQLDFEKKFLDGLKHKAIPMVGNHELPDILYEDESELRFWKERFGSLYTFFDINGWRLIFLNSMIPNPGKKYNKGVVYGLDKSQLAWLNGLLNDADKKKKKVLLFSHVSTRNYTNIKQFEKVVISYGCVKGMFYGHNHRNTLYLLSNIPIMGRVGNAMSPMAYTMVYPYPDGRFIVVQKSQHFPFLDFSSTGFRQGAQGSEWDRYFTIGGSSRLPLRGLKLIGKNTSAQIKDGHLRIDSGNNGNKLIQDSNSRSSPENDRGTILIDVSSVKNARISFSGIMEGASRMGAIGLAESDGTGGIEAVVASRNSKDGQLYLSRNKSNEKEILDRSWFNISDGIAYKFVLEVQEGKVKSKWKNMPELSANIEKNRSGKFGLFVEGGTMLITDLKLERL